MIEGWPSLAKGSTHSLLVPWLALLGGSVREFGFRVSGSRVGEFRAWSCWSLGFRAEGLGVQGSDKRPDGVGLQV